MSGERAASYWVLCLLEAWLPCGRHAQSSSVPLDQLVVECCCRDALERRVLVRTE